MAQDVSVKVITFSDGDGAKTLLIGVFVDIICPIPTLVPFGWLLRLTARNTDATATRPKIIKSLDFVFTVILILGLKVEVRADY